VTHQSIVVRFIGFSQLLLFVFEHKILITRRDYPWHKEQFPNLCKNDTCASFFTSMYVAPRWNIFTSLK